jgi:hypothetical protein
MNLAIGSVNEVREPRRSSGKRAAPPARFARRRVPLTSLDEGDVMSDWSEQQHDPPATGGENRGVEEDVVSSSDEGARTAQTTPPIADDAAHGQTQTPAPPDDVGVPSDEEIAREEESDEE